MISNADIAVWILFVASLAVTEFAAATRELSGSPMVSQDATISTSQEKMMEWLRITAVPLGVFLMGACIWGCIKNSVFWRNLTSERPKESTADEMQSGAGLPNSSSPDRSDVEEGNAKSDRRNMDGSPGLCPEIESNPESGVGGLAPSL